MKSLQLVISNETHEVSIKEYDGQRVVTLRDVDSLHRSALGAARKNFNYNKDRFIEGEDYFVVNCDEAKSMYSLKAPNGLILLAESGYLMLVKSLNDDLAWQVQRQLVKSYFKVKKSAQEQVIPTSQEDIMIFALQSQKEMKQRLESLETENHKLSLIVNNSIFLDDHQKAEIQESVKRRVGYLMKKGYEPHFQTIYSALKVFFTVPKYDKILRKDFDEAMDFVNGWYPKKSEENA